MASLLAGVVLFGVSGPVLAQEVVKVAGIDATRIVIAPPQTELARIIKSGLSAAYQSAPKDTRAYFRGMCLQKYSDEVVSASWDSVIFDLKEGPLKKIFMLEPLRGTEAHVRQLFDESPTAADLLRNLGKPSGDF